MKTENPIDVVNEQGEDEGLWFVCEYITEDYLQRALRRLHAAVEKHHKQTKNLNGQINYIRDSYTRLLKKNAEYEKILIDAGLLKIDIPRVIDISEIKDNGNDYDPNNNWGRGW